MISSFILFGASSFFLFVGACLMRNGFRKDSFESSMRWIHYRPIRNYGKGFSILLGALCVILAIALLMVQFK